MEIEDKIKGVEFIGIVEDNIDPDKKQRIKIRIPYLHGSKEEIPTTALPWSQPLRDNSGLSFSIPEINKIVNVTFPSGNLYYPVYNNAQHLNINLQKKIEEYDGKDYTKFVSFCYNYNTQIYFDTEEYHQYYKKSGLNISEEDIILRRRDKSVNIKIGNIFADEQAVLGTKFFDFFDEFMDTLMVSYIGNNGINVTPTPDMIQIQSKYKILREKFLSDSIYFVNNDNNKINDIKIDSSVGDKYTLSVTNKELNIVVAESNKVVESNNDVSVVTAKATEDESFSVVDDLVVNIDIEGPIIVEQLENIQPLENNIEITYNNKDGKDYKDPLYVSDDENDIFGDDEGYENYNNNSEDYDIFGDNMEEDDGYYRVGGGSSGSSGGSDYSYVSTINYSSPSIYSTDGKIGFDYSSKSFIIPKKNQMCQTEYLLYIDHKKLPKPTLNKKILLNWKLKAEGGLSNDPNDTASKNPKNICPGTYGGKSRCHTNRGVTYSVWKTAYPKRKSEDFFTMTVDEMHYVFYTLFYNPVAKSKYESVNCLIASICWGSGRGGFNKHISPKLKKLGGNDWMNLEENHQIALILSVRYQFFINISQPNLDNNIYRYGWLNNNGLNGLVKKVYG